MFAPPHGPWPMPRGVSHGPRCGRSCRVCVRMFMFQPAARLSGAKMLACSDARAKRSPHAPLGIVYAFIFRNVAHACLGCAFPEAASRQCAARYWDRALQPDLQPDRHSLRFWRLPCFRRLRCFPCLCSPHSACARLCPPCRNPGVSGWLRPRSCRVFLGRNASPKDSRGFLLSKEPRGVLRPENYLSRTSPGVCSKQRPDRGRMGFTLAARGVARTRTLATCCQSQSRVAGSRQPRCVRHATLAAYRGQSSGNPRHAAPRSFFIHGGLRAMR